MPLRDAIQELRELGVRGAAFRAGWEVRTRLPSSWSRAPAGPVLSDIGTEWTSHLPLEDPLTLVRWMRPLIPEERFDRLRQRANKGARGSIFSFGRRYLDFGWPINWHLNPTTGAQWSARSSWVESLTNPVPGDVKDCWEIGRFPHAYHLSRASAFFPEDAERYADALVAQIRDFSERNPPGRGIHWASGQEIGFRLLAWLFALDVLLLRTKAGQDGVPVVRDALIVGATEIERHLDYARIAVYNNHLLSEALALFGVGALLPDYHDGIKWRELGRRLLDEQAEAQFYGDGAYIQQSHNYHRVAIQDYLWACIFARSMGDSPSASWLAALERSLDFLHAHQNPLDGRLPNYGANDGSLPSILSTCDFSDMRPELQTVSLLARGERLYEAGPWDETAAWFLGVRSLDAKISTRGRESVAFADTGYFVARGNDPTTFATFRCGTLRDRFSQIDMLHADIWWNGLNVLVDGGSYRYNGDDRWHEHFMRTSGHNTVKVDGRDQMLHYRRFKVLYWTRAELLTSRDEPEFTLFEGQHYGFKRHEGHCVHQRSLVHVKDGLWIVVDTIFGNGQHWIDLQWLGGEFDWRPAPGRNGMDLLTPAGRFEVRTFWQTGKPALGDVMAGMEPTPATPARGWLSRYYGERIAVPSFQISGETKTPVSVVSILGTALEPPEVDGAYWRVRNTSHQVEFCIKDGHVIDLIVAEAH